MSFDRNNLPVAKSMRATSTAVLAALQAIVNECTDYPTEPRYSTDSYLPSHLLKVAQQAIDAATQEGIK